MLGCVGIVGILSGCSAAPTPTPAPDPAVQAILARYEPLDTLTGECVWFRAKVAPFRNVIGQLLPPDEHNPARFVPRDGASLPAAARIGGAVAFTRSDASIRARALALQEDARVSGRLVTGELRCSGNSASNPGADHSMHTGFLLDRVDPAGTAGSGDPT